MNILIVQGHPRQDSLCAAFADRYVVSAREAGASVQVLSLPSLVFDPLIDPRHRSLPLEEDLVNAQAQILWADHLVFVFPCWWGTYPALLKAFIDRTFLSGFAFRFGSGFAVERLLRGKTARMLMTLDTPPFWYSLVRRAPALHAMTHSTLEFCGVRCRKPLMFSPVRSSTPAKRQRWFSLIGKTAGQDAKGR